MDTKTIIEEVGYILTAFTLVSTNIKNRSHKRIENVMREPEVQDISRNENSSLLLYVNLFAT